MRAYNPAFNYLGIKTATTAAAAATTHYYDYCHYYTATFFPFPLHTVF